MTRSDDFIKQLEAYLDDYEGLTPLPSAVREAVRAEVPRTKQAGPLDGLARYMTMNMKGPAQLALAAAAAILVAAVGIYLLNGRNVGAPAEPTPTPTSSPAAEASPTAEASQAACAATTASVPSPGSIEVVWCALDGSGGAERVVFTMEAPEDWIDQVYGEGALYLRPSSGGAIVFDAEAGQSPEEWLAEVNGRPEYVVEDLPSITIAGATATVFDVILAPGVSSGDAPPLIDDANPPWNVSASSPSRVWVVDRAGEALVIVTGENLAEALGEALQTLEWGS